jgi:Tfp pilus assembly protein PilW
VKRAAASLGFTLAEAMIAMAGTSIIVTAMMFSSITVQKSLRASELHAASQNDQRRLLDYFSRDLRRAVGIGTTSNINGSGAVKLNSTAMELEGDTILVLTLPGYYRSNEPGSALFDQPYSVTTAGERVDYGPAGALATKVLVTFRKVYVAPENSICFVRQEAGNASVIVRNADNLHLQLELTPDGQAATLKAWLQAPSSSLDSTITTYDRVLLRNSRLD